MTSPELTGGAGFTYEDAFAAYYLVAMVGGTTATGFGLKGGRAGGAAASGLRRAAG